MLRMSTSLGVVLFLAVATVGEASAQAGAAPPPPAPPPGSPAIFRAHADMQADLSRSMAEGRAMASARIVLTDQYRGAMVRRTEANGAIRHPGHTEMHYIVEGSGTVETGGTVVRRDGEMATIQGGESRRVVPGDIVIIPDGSPHRYSEVVEPITYLEFRVVAPN